MDNAESYGNSYSPRSVMQHQGAEAFIPVHAVFGVQTSLNAANNPNLRNALGASGLLGMGVGGLKQESGMDVMSGPLDFDPGINRAVFIACSHQFSSMSCCLKWKSMSDESSSGW